MLRSIVFLTLVAGVMLLPACATVVSSSPGALLKNNSQSSAMIDLAKRIDDYIAPLAATSDFSGTIYVKRDGEPPLVLRYGYADWSRAVPHGDDTRYSAASITKGVTAATLVSFQRDGIVSLDDPVGLWLPALAEYPDVTLNAVLRHQAGLPRDFPDDVDLSKGNITSWLAANPDKIQPAGKERYSNIGYALLAEVLSAVANQPFQDVARERVLTPLGMNDSIVRLKTADSLPNGARPYTAGPEPDGVMAPVAAPLEVGSSGLITTAEDLARWARALADGAYPELFLGDDPLGSIDTGSDDNGDYVSVQGTLPGYGANAIAWRDRELTISYAGNLFSYPSLNMATTLRALVGEMPLASPSPRPAGIELTAEHMARVGKYRHPDFGPIEIAFDEGKQGLFLTMPGKPAYWSFYLTPIARGGLHWRAFGNIFYDGEDGTGLTATVQRVGRENKIMEVKVESADALSKKG